jgi:hypothetical protein
MERCNVLFNSIELILNKVLKIGEMLRIHEKWELKSIMPPKSTKLAEHHSKQRCCDLWKVGTGINMPPINAKLAEHHSKQFCWNSD